MKKLYSLFLLLGILNTQLKAQLTADSVPSGMFSVDPNVSVSVVPCGTADSVYFDLNCDNVNDMKIWLYKGYTMIDGANWAYLYVLNDSIEVCQDTAGAYSGAYRRPHYFAAGDPLAPTSTSMWSTDSVYQLGDYGCMMCYGPYTQSNVYIGYRKGTQLSWMKISFSFIDGGSCSVPITVTVNKILSPCTGNSIIENYSDNHFTIGPDPMLEMTTLHSFDELNDVTVIITNCLGQEVRRIEHVSGYTVDIHREDLIGGFYFIHVAEKEKQLLAGKFMIIQGE